MVPSIEIEVLNILNRLSVSRKSKINIISSKN